MSVSTKFSTALLKVNVRGIEERLVGFAALEAMTTVGRFV
jgi:hypothetical protein